MAFFVKRNAPALERRYDQLARQELGKRVHHVAVGVFVQVALQSLVELFLVERRLEVDGSRVASVVNVAQMGARREDHRTTHAKMREQHFAEVRINCLLGVVVAYFQRHIAQRQALHGLAFGVAALQRHQRGLGRYDRMPCLLREPVAVSGGAGERIALAAAAHDHAVGKIGLLFALYADCLAVFGFEREHRVLHEPAAVVEHKAAHGVHHVHRLVGLRIAAVAALGFERHADLFKKRVGVRRREAADRRIKEPAVDGHILYKGRHVAVVEDVAPALAGYHQLAAHTGILLYQCHRRAASGGCSGCHHACRTCADDNYFFTVHGTFSSPRPRGWYRRPRGSRPAPAHGRSRSPRPSF